MKVHNRILECLDDTHKVGLDWQGSVIHRYGVPGVHDAKGIAARERMDNNVGRKMAYHLVISPDGVIEQALPFDVVGWHARSHSRKMIGIACIGDFRRHEMPDAQWESLVWFLTHAAITNRKINFTFHDFLPAGSNDLNKQCPGKMLDYGKLVDQVKSEMERVGRGALTEAGLSLEPVCV